MNFKYTIQYGSAYLIICTNGKKNNLRKTTTILVFYWQKQNLYYPCVFEYISILCLVNIDPFLFSHYQN